MPRITRTIFAGGLLLAGLITLPARASESPPALVLFEAKVTGSDGQFFTLFNQSTNKVDLADYKLAYYNNVDPERSTSKRQIGLKGELTPKGYLQVLDDDQPACYRALISAVSLGFSSTSGTLQILKTASGAAPPQVEDYLNWTKQPNNSAQTLPTVSGSYLQRRPPPEGGSDLVGRAGEGTWQAVIRDTDQPCLLRSFAAGQPADVLPPPLNQLLMAAAEPPSLVLPAQTGEAAAPVNAPPAIPVEDIGLKLPQITELLPNPLGSGNDSTDEFIELYNPNDKEFVLTGFRLGAGTKSIRTYSFPAGLRLPPKSFTAFYSEETGLSLSNSGSQAVFAGPGGEILVKTEPYPAAKDGQPWALANGKWQWSTRLTPGAMNVIVAPPAKQPAGSKSKSAAGKTQPSDRAATKQTVKTIKSQAGNQTSPAAANGRLINRWLLALIAVGAVIYVAYEYRADLANKFAELRGHTATGRKHRPPAEGG